MSTPAPPNSSNSRPLCIGVLGGDGRPIPGLPARCRVKLFRARRYGGNGELRRLERSLRSGGIDQLWVLTRWNSHSCTRLALRLCRRLGVPVELVA